MTTPVEKWLTMQHRAICFSESIFARWAACFLAVWTVGIGCFFCSQANSRESAAADDAAHAKAVQLGGPIFTDWPKPQVAILFSGELDGYLEPCGCAGLENQKGGLKRRHALIKQLRERGWPLVALDLGGQIRRFGPQANTKFRYALKSLVELGYSGVGLGTHELQLDTNLVLYVIANLDPEANPLVSANVALFGFDSGFTSRYRVIEAGGKRIGVTSVLGSKHQADLKNVPDITWIDPAESLNEIAPKLAADHCDWQVLLVHGDSDEARQLAKLYPQFNLVATTGGAEEPPNRADDIEGTTNHLIEVGHKGMYVAVVGLYDDPASLMRYQRVPLDARFGDSPEMQAMMVEYQKELELLGFEGLGIMGVKHSAGQFVGSEACADCHTEATEVFEKTPHAHATQTLVDLDPPRHFDPECLSCHVTGWDAQRYFPYASGYTGLKQTPHLRANGCENCHGPGTAHVAAESGDEDVSEKEQRKRRRAMRLIVAGNEGNGEGQKLGTVVKKCLECHDLDNSPEFDFQKYWPEVEHHGKD